ncbi:MAG TPA: ATPase domain-containing protein, partial [Acidiferrobacteraceae bacterium]|nr:ATPase domain-containing protein [Acidiferrobacteraceae bacterium]
MSFVSTGIAGLDYVLCGGLPQGRLYLIQGEPGTGKTTLAMQFLLAGRDLGETVMYITLSETEEELRAVAQTHRWDLSGLIIRDLSVLEEQLGAAAENTLFHPSEIELTDTMQVLLASIEALKPQR